MDSSYNFSAVGTVEQEVARIIKRAQAASNKIIILIMLECLHLYVVILKILEVSHLEFEGVQGAHQGCDRVILAPDFYNAEAILELSAERLVHSIGLNSLALGTFVLLSS
jgi:hypothetical protein